MEIYWGQAEPLTQSVYSTCQKERVKNIALPSRSFETTQGNIARKQTIIGKLKENHIINYKSVYLQLKSGVQHPLRLRRSTSAEERKKTGQIPKSHKSRYKI